ncbi:DUF3080 family protein [Amphritea sp. HPY]|uniref:DUF3080 family protein n=1 Tax=Amphritea sp. HPY TaxID=3421652 RepID=UPI003D7C875E
MFPARLISLLLFIFITGCAEDTPEQMLERYHQRLANSLDQTARLDLQQPLPLPHYPKRRTRLIEVTEVRQGLYEVLNLRHCQLLPLIAERNSSLGKVKQPSQQLIYEFKLYDGLRKCRSELKQKPADPELQQQIEEIWRIKRQNLPRVIWNSLYNSEEMERNFSLSEPALAINGEDGFTASMQALQRFELLSALAYEHPAWQLPEYINDLEQDYGALYHNRYGSRWLRSITQLTLTLKQSAAVIEDRLSQRPLCFKQQATPQAKIVLNVFQKFYAAQVQPYMARLDRQGKRWLEQHNLILQNLAPVIPASVKNYRQRILSTDLSSLSPALWPDYISARDQHTDAWQKLLGQCGLMPSTKK